MLEISDVKCVYEVNGYRVPEHSCYDNIIKEPELIEKYRLFHKVVYTDKKVDRPAVIGAVLHDILIADYTIDSLTEKIGDDYFVVDISLNGEDPWVDYISPGPSKYIAEFAMSIDWYLRKYEKYLYSDCGYEYENNVDNTACTCTCNSDNDDKSNKLTDYEVLDIKHIYEVSLYAYPRAWYRSSVGSHRCNQTESENAKTLGREKLDTTQIGYKIIKSDGTMRHIDLLKEVFKDIIHNDEETFLHMTEDNVLLFTIRHNGNLIYENDRMSEALFNCIRRITNA